MQYVSPQHFTLACPACSTIVVQKPDHCWGSLAHHVVSISSLGKKMQRLPHQFSLWVASTVAFAQSPKTLSREAPFPRHREETQHTAVLTPDAFAEHASPYQPVISLKNWSKR